MSAMVGGLKPMDVRGLKTLEVAKFVMDSISQCEEKIGRRLGTEMIRIVRAASQIVAGMRYEIVLDILADRPLRLKSSVFYPLQPNEPVKLLDAALIGPND